jgi:hypothetical protein
MMVLIEKIIATFVKVPIRPFKIFLVIKIINLFLQTIHQLLVEEVNLAVDQEIYILEAVYD